MKRLLILVSLIAIGYFAYQYFPGVSKMVSQTPSISSRTKVITADSKAGDILQVLGTSTSSLFTKGKDLLNTATAGQAEPVINKIVSDLQDKVKSLPEEEYKKVKYEFCKDVIVSPAPKEEI